MNTLNEKQQAAVEAKDQLILCLAGAGTGKTETMISRVVRLVDEGVSPDSILVLTFTNAAATEMTARYRRKHAWGRIPTFATFHAYCYRLLTVDARLRERLGYNDVPTVADDIILEHLQNSIVSELNINLSTGKLKGKQTLSPKDQFQFDLYQREFNKRLRQRGFITFDIMCYEVCKLFEENDPLIQFHRDQLKYIFVDEFQDTDPKQWKFIASVPCEGVFVVGDPKQSIYQFRGADSSIIKFLAESDDWNTIQLTHNYRSTQQVCDLANTIHRSWQGSAYNLQIESKTQGPEPIFLKQSESYITKIDDLLKEHDGETIAVLARTNAEVSYLKQSLVNETIMDKVTAKTAERAYHLLNSALSDEYFISWISSVLTGNTYRDWMRVLNLIGPDIQKIIDTIPNSQIVERDWNRILDIRDMMEDTTQLPFQKAVNIADFLTIPTKMIEIHDDTPEGIVDAVLSAMVVPNQSKIHVGTIHSVKGLEYDMVILVGLGGKTFQLTSEDMINLYYVAVTRAKKSLYIFKKED